MNIGNRSKGETVNTIREPIGKYRAIFTSQGQQIARDHLTGGAEVYHADGNIVVEFDVDSDASAFIVLFSD